jgi:hypothetical protein
MYIALMFMLLRINASRYSRSKPTINQPERIKNPTISATATTSMAEYLPLQAGYQVRYKNGVKIAADRQEGIEN